ncbi:MAG: EAL domain-containing protein [Undibacterium sp.]|nr:EAL domain-containing protein [Undibacterium sp.]
MTLSIEHTLATLMQKFSVNLPVRLDAIRDQFVGIDRAVWQLDQWQEVHRLIHSITGSAGTFGMQPVSDAARVVEELLKQVIRKDAAPSELEWQAVNAELERLNKVARNGLASSARLKPPVVPQAFDQSPLIYIVEDDPEQASNLHHILRDEGYRARVFANSAQLCSAFVDTDVELPAAVLMDMILPGGPDAGVELIDKLGLRTEYGIPVILISVRDDLPARLAALRAGACRYMTKPIQPRHLIDQLDAITGRQPREPYRVLMVDDDVLLLEVHAAVLRAAGMEVRTLTEPMQIIDALNECDPDLVVLDVYMPEASGPELAAVLRERDGQLQLPILFLSTEADLTAQLLALNLGGDDFLMKPIQPQHLLVAVATRIRRARQSRAIRQRLETTLYEREVEHHALNHHAIVSLTDRDGQITYVNEKFCEISGYTRDELLGQNCRLLKSGEHLPAFYQALWQSINTGETWQGEICNRRKDGSLFWLAETINSFMDSADVPYQYAAISTDITYVKMAEAALRVSEERNLQLQRKQDAADKQQLLDRVTDAFVSLDNDWCYTYANKAAGQMFGRTPEQLIGKNIWTEFPEGVGQEFHQVYLQAMADRKPAHLEAYYPPYEKWFENRIYPSEAGLTIYFQDITARKLAEKQIEHLAYFDALTGLPNRRLLVDRLHQVLASTTRNHKHGALIYIDLDHFKTLNDTRGHELGDLFLQEVARRLSSSLREGDTAARLGGDEFVVMLCDLAEDPIESASQAEAVAENILFSLNQSIELGGQTYNGTVSIGIALFGEPGITTDDLLKWADIAMYQAKAAHRNTLRFFDPRMQEVVNGRAAMENDLREAILQQQFVLYYQIQVDEHNRATGAEALIRWRHPVRGIVSPLEFIALAEETGLILPIGQWVLETACKQLVQWAADPAVAQLTLAVNVSARQFRLPTLVEQVLAIVNSSGANPHRLKLELTESMLLDDVENMIRKMADLRAHGISFALDDFGTGYSSLAYLKRLPLDQIKIDRSFVRDVLTDPNDAAIARTVVALAHGMGLAVIAEGVETEGQRDFLAANGCLAYQGYLFGHPLPIAEFNALTTSLSTTFS